MENLRFGHLHYVPALRWKRGEGLALSQLSDKARDTTTPLIEIAEIPYDFKRQTEGKSIDEHLKPLARQVRNKWGQRWCFVDPKLVLAARTMQDGSPIAKFVFDQLRAEKCLAIPVTTLKRKDAYQKVIKGIIAKDKHGTCIRLSLEEATAPGLKAGLNRLLGNIRAKIEDCHLVLDLSAPPNFDPLSGFAKLVAGAFANVPSIAGWRSVTVLGTSLPPRVTDLPVGATVLKRSEWRLWKAIIEGPKAASHRLPTFGDYGARYPYSGRMPDPRIIRSSARLFYSTNDAWFTIKGLVVRDYGLSQFAEHCASIVRSKHYAGADFSVGDRYIGECAAGREGPGNLTTWVQVTTNHHIERAVSDIASFFAS